MPKQSATFAVLAVSPETPVAIVGPEGGPFSPTAVAYSVFNNGTTEALQWTVSCDVAWLDISVLGGTVGPNRAQQVVFTPNSAAESLLEGAHIATITFQNITPSFAGSGQPSPYEIRTIQLNATGGIISPGAGWGGATSEPGQIGTGTAKCIARWDVVPYQTVVEATTPTFTVGVVAFHIAGIEKVSFSVEDGTWVDVTEMTLNARTGVWEYCATLDLSEFTSDGLVEIRAIAYPKAGAPPAEGTGAYPGGGYPRLLESMFLYLDVDTAQTPNVAYCAPWGSDSTGAGTAGNPYATPFKAAQLCHTNGSGNASNGIVYMEAGDYQFGPAAGGTTPATPDAYITFRPAPGVMPSQVRFTTSGASGMGIGKIRLSNIMIHSPIGGVGAANSQRLWLDACGVSGIDDTNPATLISSSGWANNFGAGVCWTDCYGGNDGNTLNPAVKLARNCHFDRCIWASAVFGCVINCSWTNLNAWGSTVHHPDFLHVNFRHEVETENLIAYGVNAHVIGASGLFFKDSWVIKNVALVNVAWQNDGNDNQLGEGCTSLDHMILWHVTGNGSLIFHYPKAVMTNCSFIGTHWWGIGKAGAGQASGLDNLQWDSTNITANWGQNYTPGSNVTVSPNGPMLDSELHPLPGSPLLGRVTRQLVPVDAANVVRTYPTSIGAFE